MKGKPKRHGLTQRQRRFVSAYLVSLNAAEAARKAGYTGPHTDSIGSKILRRPAVKDSIDKALSSIMGAEAATIKHRVINELLNEAFIPEGRSKMKALELLAKYGGLLIEKHEVTGKDGGPITLQWPDDNNPAT